MTVLTACHPNNPIDPGTTDVHHADSQIPAHPAGCGDGLCDANENTINCVADCGSWCGDGQCNGQESAELCPQDCVISPPSSGPGVCGNGTCDPNENTVNCTTDCGSLCGDDTCNGTESTITCPQDCGRAITPPSNCGDGVCSPGEDAVSCSLDCVTAPDELVFNIIIRQTHQSCSGCGIWFDWQGKQADKPRLAVKYEHDGVQHTAEYQHGLGGMDNAHAIWIQSGKAHDDGNKHEMLIKKGPHRNGLLRVDVSDIPADATITQARLHLHINKHEGLANGDHSSVLMVHESAREWDWNSVSWTHAATGQPWTTTGGDLGREVREIHAGVDMHDLGFNKGHPNGFFDFTPYMQLLQSERGKGSVCGDGLCAEPESQANCTQDCGNQNNPDP